MRTTWLCVFGLACTACGDDASSTPPDASLAAWDPTLPVASEMGVRRGLTPARGIVHLHSPYSHDACDGDPRPGGTPNEPCLAHLRAALCAVHIDFANLTDHDDSMADEDFSTLMSMRGTDTPIMRDGTQIGSRIQCEDGHTVAVSVGGENDLMPIMLDRHVEGTVSQRHDIYNANDAAASAAYRAAGGLTWVAHTESKTLETLRAVAPDGIEVYNLHANIDPDIRKDFLGLDSFGGITSVVDFADHQPGHPVPDLAMLGFLLPNGPAIDKWQTLLGEGRHIAITAGSDAHENALPIMMADGERGDAYRRVMRWFSNIALVGDPRDVDQVQAALAAGRNFAVFELFGTPIGFDARVVGTSGTSYELGATVPLADAPLLKVDVPTVRNLDPALPAPSITVKAYWVATTGAVEQILSSDGQTSGGTASVPLAGPGAYRVEVSIIPRHLGPHLHDLGPALAEIERPWIYTGAFYVE